MCDRDPLVPVKTSGSVPADAFAFTLIVKDTLVPFFEVIGNPDTLIPVGSDDGPEMVTFPVNPFSLAMSMVPVTFVPNCAETEG